MKFPKLLFTRSIGAALLENSFEKIEVVLSLDPYALTVRARAPVVCPFCASPARDPVWVGGEWTWNCQDACKP